MVYFMEHSIKAIHEKEQAAARRRHLSRGPSSASRISRLSWRI